MYIRFTVQCDKCHQILGTPDGVVHKHDNPDDCDGGQVELPLVTTDDLAALFGGMVSHADPLADVNAEAAGIMDELISEGELRDALKPESAPHTFHLPLKADESESAEKPAPKPKKKPAKAAKKTSKKKGK